MTAQRAGMVRARQGLQVDTQQGPQTPRTRSCTHPKEICFNWRALGALKGLEQGETGSDADLRCVGHPEMALSLPTSRGETTSLGNTFWSAHSVLPGTIRFF